MSESELKRPTIGRIVIYRSKTADYDLPAIVTGTVESLDPVGLELGHVAPLRDESCVHLTVFTCGRPGTSREDNEPNPNVAGGTYQEVDIPPADEDGEIAPGTWRWPERA